MGSFDTVTWQALTGILTLAALGATVLVWRRNGAAAGLRMLAVALLPSAAYLTGTLRMLWEIGDAVVGWATRLVLGPTVWLGIALAVLAVVLFVLGGVLGRSGRAAGRDALRSPPLPGSKAPAVTPGTGGRGAAPEDEDLADIEAILKRHGIS